MNKINYVHDDKNENDNEDDDNTIPRDVSQPPLSVISMVIPEG